MSHLAALGDAFASPALDALGPVRIVDVGANPLGRPLYQSLLEAGLAEVWGFEPNEDAFAKLAPGAGRHWIKAAVGAPGPATFNAYPASEMSSIYKMSKDGIGYLGHFKRHLGTETEHAVTLQALDDLDDLPQIDCLKIDAQGAERDVICHGHGKLADAVAVVAEMRFYRLYDGEPPLGALDLELRDQGFVLHRFLHQKARMIGHSQRREVNARAIGSQLIDGDAVYIRSLEEPGLWSAHQLARLALLAAEMFDSHDLVLFCLDRLAERGAISAEAPRRYAQALPGRLRA